MPVPMPPTGASHTSSKPSADAEDREVSAGLSGPASIQPESGWRFHDDCRHGLPPPIRHCVDDVTKFFRALDTVRLSPDPTVTLSRQALNGIPIGTGRGQQHAGPLPEPVRIQTRQIYSQGR